MKKSLFLATTFLSLIFYSCSGPKIKEERIEKKHVDSCIIVPKVSVHDEINPRKWRVYSDGISYISHKPYEVGDSIEITYITYK